MEKHLPKYSIPERQIRAFFTKDFIRVYQAYSDEIADSAIKNNTFVSPPFSLTRMTWIKPSFLWMMYRSGWGKKDSNQTRILAIDLSHDAFQKILHLGVPSDYHSASTFQNKEEWQDKIKNSDIIFQWDPERDIHLNKLNYRTIQIGIRNQAVINFCNKWIVNLHDITHQVQEIHNLVSLGDFCKAKTLIPTEKTYHFQL
ncbi:DUF4291 domain-containing protein [Klebsiella aerogenes]